MVPEYQIELEDLVEFRRDHIGTPEDAIRKPNVNICSS